MFKYIYSILVVLLLGNLAYAQNATPSRYTTFIGLRCYASGANAGADSLNANWDDIDSTAKAMNDTIVAVKADVYSVINYSGGIIDGTVMWNDMSTSAKANVVQVTGTQTIAGIKTLTDNINVENIYPTTTSSYTLGAINAEWYRIYTKSLRTHTLVIVNPVDTSQSSEVSYDGTNVTFDNNITFADTTKKIGDSDMQLNAIYTDSVKSPNNLILNANHIIMQGIFGIGGGTLSSHTIGATDSVTIVPTSSFVYLNTTATTSISYISPLAITPGLIYVITTDGSDSVTLLDGAGNLQLEGNFVMDTASDVIVLMKSGTIAGGLIELFRSNNE